MRGLVHVIRWYRSPRHPTRSRNEVHRIRKATRLFITGRIAPPTEATDATRYIHWKVSLLLAQVLKSTKAAKSTDKDTEILSKTNPPTPKFPIMTEAMAPSSWAPRASPTLVNHPSRANSIAKRSVDAKATFRSQVSRSTAASLTVLSVRDSAVNRFFAEVP